MSDFSSFKLISRIIGCLGVAVALPISAEPFAPSVDAGAIMRTMPRQEPPTPSQMPALDIENNEPSLADNSLKLNLVGWKLSGVTLIPQEELQDLIKGYIGKEVGLGDLQRAARTVATYFREHGYFVRAFLPQQDIKDGVVEIRVVEGKLGGLIIEDPRQVLSPVRVENTLTGAQPKGQTLELQNLERGILLLGDFPGVAVNPTLRPGKHVGESDLTIKVDPRPTFNGSLDYSNTGIRSVGQNVFGGSATANNVFGNGDQTNLLLQGGTNNVFGRVGFSMPMGYSGLRVGVSASNLYYHLINEYLPLDTSGNAWTGGFYATYPWVRTSNFNLWTTAGFDTRRYHNIAGYGLSGIGSALSGLGSDNTLQVGYVGFNTDYRDSWLGSDWAGYNTFNFTTVMGSVDLTDNQPNYQLDRTTAKTQGAYQKFSFGASRLQQLPEKLSFFAGFYGQLATKNLNSSEKFALGGPNGVRAYPVNEALGDEGYLMKFELRYDVYENIQLVGFIDHGGITRNNYGWAGSNGGAPNTYTLSGGGAGINWIAPGNFAVKVSVAQRIGTNPARNVRNGTDVDGSYDTPHFWAQLSKYF